MKQIAYLRTLFAFAFKNNPLLYAIIFVTFVSVCLELAAITILVPLSVLASGGVPNSQGMAVKALGAIGIPIEGRSLLLTFIGFLFARIATQFLGQAMTSVVGRRILLQLTTRAFSALIRNVSIAEIEKKTIGYFITLAGDEANRSSNLIGFICQLFSLLLLGVLYFVAIATFSPKVAIAVVVFLSLTSLAMLLSLKATHRLGVRQVEQSQALGSLFIDSLNGLRAVRAFSAEAYVTNSYHRQLSAYVRTLVASDTIGELGRAGPMMLLLVIVAAAVVFFYSDGANVIDLPYVITIIVLLIRFFPTVGYAFGGIQRIVTDARAGRDVTEIIDRYSADTTEDYKRPNGHVESIVVNNLTFAHVPGKPVLKGLNLRFDRGSTYAITGASGSGKSTFLDLLLGFYPPAGGRLLIDSTPIERIASKVLRRHIVLFTQDTAIFNDTVANNLRMGLDASAAELKAACEIASIHDFIAELPDGYDTMLAYRGSNFSGGQRQRIGIARAVLRKPDVLLLDESTSALDAATRDEVVGHLIDTFKDRILIFVTHDNHIIQRVGHVFDMAKVNKAVDAPDTSFETAASA